MLPRDRRRVATQDWDSSIHEVYGNKKEGADWAYNNTWSYNGLYGALAETGDLLYLGLREGYRHPAMCLMVAKFAGACALRMRHSSSRNTMSITQCSSFSTPQ